VSALPPERPTPWAPPPDGFHFEVFHPDEWKTPPCGAGRCRYMVGGKACGATPVASLLRRAYYRDGVRSVPWDYCADHLYGSWLEDGKVTRWRLVPDAEES
jgi:hypothetical protein